MGVFFDRSTGRSTIKIDLGDIYDGTSQTIMVAENCDAGGENFNSSTPSQWNRILESEVGVCWFETNELAQADIDSNNYIGFGEFFNTIKPAGFTYPGYDFARPASYHSGVVNILFCDGSVQAIRRGLDYRLYCQAMTPDSRKVGNTSRGYGTISSLTD